MIFAGLWDFVVADELYHPRMSTAAPRHATKDFLVAYDYTAAGSARNGGPIGSFPTAGYKHAYGAGRVVYVARPALPRSWVVFKSPELERDILRAKSPARAHAGAPHCGLHCHQLGVCLTPHFFVAGHGTRRAQ